MKILALIPESQKRSPVRVYRGEGMLEKLNAQVDYFEPEIMRLEWAGLMRLAKQYAWLFVLRSAHQEHVQICNRLQAFGLKLWYDLDDDYSGVEPDNTAWPAFQRPEMQAAYRWFLENADLVTYSTKTLADKFGNGHVCPNALDDQIFAMDIEYPKPKRGLITWRGGGTHFQDLQYYQSQISDFLATNTDWEMRFIGFYAWWFSKFGNVMFTEYIQDYWYYMSYLQQQRPWGHIVPLRDCAFNRAKSCISALEAVYAGACPVVPDWEEWQLPGALKYNTPLQFLEKMQELVKMSDDEHKARWQSNMEWIRENRALSVVNQKRLLLLSENNK